MAQSKTHSYWAGINQLLGRKCLTSPSIHSQKHRFALHFVAGYGQRQAHMTQMNDLSIVAYSPEFRKQVVDIAIKAWAPVFPLTRMEVPGFVYDNFWPQGWETRQAAEVSALLDTEPEAVWLAFKCSVLAGFVVISIHPDDQMGEVSIVAVSPDYQRKGIGKALMDFAEQRVRAKGMKMIMVETVGDSGHEPARRTYESLGYERWPVARYFKKL